MEGAVNRGFLVAMLIVAVVALLAGYVFVLTLPDEVYEPRGLQEILIGSGILFSYGVYLLLIVRVGRPPPSAWNYIWRSALLLWGTMVSVGVLFMLLDLEEPTLLTLALLRQRAILPPIIRPSSANEADANSYGRKSR